MTLTSVALTLVVLTLTSVGRRGGSAIEEAAVGIIVVVVVIFCFGGFADDVDVDKRSPEIAVTRVNLHHAEFRITFTDGSWFGGQRSDMIVRCMEY